MNKEIIKTDKAPGAIGPYSQAVRVGDFIFASGQVPLVPETGELVTGTIEEQTERAMENIKGLLESQGLTMANIVKTTVFMTDMNDFAKMNGVYGKYFDENPPARSAVQVAALPKGANVEIETISIVK